VTASSIPEQRHHLPDETLRDWLALIHSKGVGPATLNPLLRAGITPEELLADPPAQLGERQRLALKNPEWRKVDADLEWLEESGARLLPQGSPRYPELLESLPDAPLALYLLGDPKLPGTPQIAIVGSRNPTRGGEQTAKDFASHLAGSGLTVTSGLALGIDSAAHRGALQGGGATIAVTATGLDRVYPARNRDLAHAIVEQGGALVSEFPPGTAPKPGHFPRRNRIISGLSLGVLVVEAALKSGSLITARLAAEQAREVFAIPGSIHNPLARGCHRLIREGAKLVETASDLLEELAPHLQLYLQENAAPGTPPGNSDVPSTPDPEYQDLLEAMGFDPVSTDTLVERTGLAPETVSSMLLLLEMEGRVASVPGGRFVRTGNSAS